jgi:hypothetical protein
MAVFGTGMITYPPKNVRVERILFRETSPMPDVPPPIGRRYLPRHPKCISDLPTEVMMNILHNSTHLGSKDFAALSMVSTDFYHESRKYAFVRMKVPVHDLSKFKSRVFKSPDLARRIVYLQVYVIKEEQTWQWSKQKLGEKLNSWDFMQNWKSLWETFKKLEGLKSYVLSCASLWMRSSSPLEIRIRLSAWRMVYGTCSSFGL